jgi:hypothetical protein
VATEEGAPYSMADAIIADNLGFKLIANFYIRVKKPLRPTRLFISEPDAINWLKKSFNLTAFGIFYLSFF